MLQYPVAICRHSPPANIPNTISILKWKNSKSKAPSCQDWIHHTFSEVRKHARSHLAVRGSPKRSHPLQTWIKTYNLHGIFCIRNLWWDISSSHSWFLMVCAPPIASTRSSKLRSDCPTQTFFAIARRCGEISKMMCLLKKTFNVFRSCDDIPECNENVFFACLLPQCRFECKMARENTDVNDIANLNWKHEKHQQLQKMCDVWKFTKTKKVKY